MSFYWGLIDLGVDVLWIQREEERDREREVCVERWWMSNEECG